MVYLASVNPKGSIIKKLNLDCAYCGVVQDVLYSSKSFMCKKCGKKNNIVIEYKAERPIKKLKERKPIIQKIN